MLTCHYIEVPSSLDIALAYLDFHTGKKGTKFTIQIIVSLERDLATLDYFV